MRSTVRVAALGDLILGDSPISVGFGMRSRYPGKSLSRVFEAVTPMLAGHDIVLGNLECPLVTMGAGSSRWRRDQMRGDPEYAAVLREAGITALNVANNHSLQHGVNAFNETVALLRDNGVATVGLRGSDDWCCEPVISDWSGLKIGILGFCWRPRQYGVGEAPFAEGTPRDAVADVERLASRCDVVIVSLHWGEDFVDLPSESETKIARSLVDAGAHVIAGHHPQVRRPVERYGGGVIAYSLGNFAADLLWFDPFRDGTVLLAELGTEGLISTRLEGIRLDDRYRPVPAPPPPSPSRAALEGLKQSSYEARAAAVQREQRRRAWGYGARHVSDYPFRVLAELAATTVHNKLRKAARTGDEDQ